MKRSAVLLALVCLLLSLPVAAAEWMVPAAAHAPGVAGTNWRTDLRILNPTGNAATARVDLLPQNTDNSDLSRHVTVSIPANGQLSLVDVLQSQFSFTGNAALLVSSTQASLVVTSRTYNEAANRSTYGQFIPGVPLERTLTAGNPGNLIYLAKSAEYRTNVGYAGTTDQRGLVHIILYDASGLQIGEGTFNVEPYGQSQINDIFAATNAPATPVARAVVISSVPLVAYASIIDNRTGDPLAMLAVAENEGANEIAIAAVAHAAGAGGSAWRSDVRIFAMGGDEDHPVTLAYYPAGVENAAPIVRTVSIGPDRILALDDIVTQTFGLPSGVGALHIISEAALFATSRTYNLSSTGTFGQDVPGTPVTTALAGNATAVYAGLSDVGYRTNVGFFNLSSTPLDLTLTLRRPDGSVIASKPYRLGGRASSQINLFVALEASGTPVASLTISGNGAASNKYVAYASVIDAASGDPVFVPATLSTAPPSLP